MKSFLRMASKGLDARITALCRASCCFRRVRRLWMVRVFVVTPNYTVFQLLEAQVCGDSRGRGFPSHRSQEVQLQLC